MSDSKKTTEKKTSTTAGKKSNAVGVTVKNTDSNKSASSKKKTGNKSASKPSTANKNSPKKKNDLKEVSAEKVPNPSSAGNVMFVVACFLLTFLLAIFFVTSFVGTENSPAVSFFCKILYGLFGFAAFFVLPILVIDAIKWKKCVLDGTRTLKIISGLILITVLSALVHAFFVLFGAVDGEFAVKELYGDGAITQNGVHGGGVIGGAVFYAFNMLFGYIALDIIFLFIFLLISLLLYTNVTPYRFVMMIVDGIKKSRAKRLERLESDANDNEDDEDDENDKDDEDEDGEPEPLPHPVKKSNNKNRSEEDENGRIKDESKALKQAEKERKKVEFDEEEEKQLKIEEEDRRRAVAEKAAELAEKQRAKKRADEEKLASAGDKCNNDDNPSHKSNNGFPDNIFVLEDADEKTSKEDKAADKKPLTTEINYEDIDVDTLFTDEAKINDQKKKKHTSVDSSVITENPQAQDFGKDFIDEDSDADKTKDNSADSADDYKDDSVNELFADNDINSIDMPDPEPAYVFPPIDLLTESPIETEKPDKAELMRNAEKLVSTLASFKVDATVVNICQGPTITRYELAPKAGVRVRQIANLVDDISLNLETSGIRIEAPIPGKAAVGIEVPNRKVSTVYLRDLIECDKFVNSKSKVTACIGRDVAGAPVVIDITRMPHLLVAGATGMGKSVSLNCILISLLYKASPDDVKFILIDPKKVEMILYNNLPHLLMPVVSNPKKAAGALSAAVTEMERRFELIESVGVRDIKSYNAAVENDPSKEHLPHIIIVIDELADLMLTAKDTVEDSICRLAQKARAAGIHLIVCTQRPSVDFITGSIKANIPSRIAFTVASVVDSRTIIDIAGAEKLIGRGDMLFAPVDAMKPIRAQGAFVSDAEVEAVTSFVKNQTTKIKYNDEFIRQTNAAAEKCDAPKKGSAAADLGDSADIDPKLWEACDVAYEMGKISTSLLQRRLSLGYGRAAKLIDKMQELGIVSAQEGQKPRNITMPREDYLALRMNGDSPASGNLDDGYEEE